MRRTLLHPTAYDLVISVVSAVLFCTGGLGFDGGNIGGGFRSCSLGGFGGCGFGGGSFWLLDFTALAQVLQVVALALLDLYSRPRFLGALLDEVEELVVASVEVGIVLRPAACARCCMSRGFRGVRPEQSRAAARRGQVYGGSRSLRLWVRTSSAHACSMAEILKRRYASSNLFHREGSVRRDVDSASSAPLNAGLEKAAKKVSMNSMALSTAPLCIRRCASASWLGWVRWA
jgi:hypothetical protein